MCENYLLSGLCITCPQYGTGVFVPARVIMDRCVELHLRLNISARSLGYCDVGDPDAVCRSLRVDVLLPV